MERTKLIAVTDGVTAKIQLWSHSRKDGVNGIVRLSGLDDEGRPFSFSIYINQLRVVVEMVEEVAKEVIEAKKAAGEGEV